MHKYLRAIGFSEVKKRDALQGLINEVVEKTILRRNKTENGKEKNLEKYTSVRDFAADEDDIVYAELFLDFAHGAGICVRGEFDDDNCFLYDYYFPYLRGNHISSNENITIERQSEKESYAGVCDDIKVGVSLIFYLQNMIPYKRLKALKRLPIQGTSLILSALEDMDIYTMISRKIHKADVFSLVDTYFMPYGVECDLYSILGEIIEIHTDQNRITKEEVVFMTLECNEMTLEVCINKIDLYGEPMVGRRFKGVVWLQGYINYP